MASMSSLKAKEGKQQNVACTGCWVVGATDKMYTHHWWCRQTSILSGFAHLFDEYDRSTDRYLRS